MKLIILFSETGGTTEIHTKECESVASSLAEQRWPWPEWLLVRFNPPAHPLLPPGLASLDAAILSPGAKGLDFEQLIARGWPLPVGVWLIDQGLSIEPEWFCKAVVYQDSLESKREIAADQRTHKEIMDRLERLRSR